MDIFLRKDYSYNVEGSYDSNKMRIEGLLNSKWFYTSRSYSGEVNEDGTFSFRQKISFLEFNMSKQGKISYINGALKQNGDGTTIDITIRPNMGLLLIMYLLLPLLFVNIVFGDNSFMGDGSRLNNSLIVFVFELVLFFLIQIM